MNTEVLGCDVATLEGGRCCAWSC